MLNEYFILSSKNLVERNAIYTCVICGDKTERYHHEHANISMKEIYSALPWCLNLDYLSHKLDRLTSPKYKKPSKEVADERKPSG